MRQLVVTFYKEKKVPEIKQKKNAPLLEEKKKKTHELFILLLPSRAKNTREKGRGDYLP